MAKRSEKYLKEKASLDNVGFWVAEIDDDITELKEQSEQLIILMQQLLEIVTRVTILMEQAQE